MSLATSFFPSQGVPYVTGFDSQIFLFAALLHLKPGGDSFLWKH
jgi:hypothetical protein